MTAEVRKNLMDLFIDGARRGFTIATTSLLPNVVMAFVIIQALKVTGLLDIVGRVCEPIMALWGLPGEAATVLLASVMSMGGGVGGLREICGAFTGAAMALNMIQKDIQTTDPEYKKRMYALVQEKAEAFKALYGTVICRELLELNDIAPSPVPAERTAEYYEVRPCGKYVEACAKLVEEELQKG